jgi:hypothetical protein
VAPRSGCRLVARAVCRAAVVPHSGRHLAEPVACRVSEQPAHQAADRWGARGAAGHSPVARSMVSAAVSSSLPAGSDPAAEPLGWRLAQAGASSSAPWARPTGARAEWPLKVAGSSDAEVRRVEAAAVLREVEVEKVASGARALPEAAAEPEVVAELGAAEQPPAAGQAGVAAQLRAAGAAQDAAVGVAAAEVAPGEVEQPPEAAGRAALDVAVQPQGAEAAPGAAGQLRAAAPWALPSHLPWVSVFRPGRLRPVEARPGRSRRARSAHGKWSLRWASPKGRSWQAARDEA